MPEEYFEVSLINDDYIIHGRGVRISPDGRREFVKIEQRMSEAQKKQYADLIDTNRTYEDKLISAFVERSEGIHE